MRAFVHSFFSSLSNQHSCICCVCHLGEQRELTLLLPSCATVALPFLPDPGGEGAVGWTFC